MHSREEEFAIIQSVLQGRQADYAILVNRYRQYVFTLVLRYVQNREMAEELAQDVFVKAYTNLHSFRQESKFSTWLYTIVHTTCLSHLRRKDSNVILLEEEKMAILQDDKYQQLPTNKLELTDTKATLQKAISQLPDTDAIVLTLYYQSAQSIEEIATITATTAANVKVRLFRARQKLKEIIEKKYKEELMR